MEALHEEYRILSSKTSEWIEVQLPILAETEKAICFDSCRADFGSHAVWIPKSQMRILDLGEDSGIRYFIKVWLYKKFNV